MWIERFRQAWAVAASIAPFLGILGFIFAARRDRVMLTTSLGLAACVCSAYLGYRLGSADGERVLAEMKQKDQRIAQLEAAARSGAARGAAASQTASAATPVGGSPTGGGTPTATACPLNDSWECAEPLAFGRQDSDVFRASDEERYYYVDIDQPRAFTVTLDPMLRSRPLKLSIHDADRREINSRGYSERSPGSVDTRVRAAGRYFIRIKLLFCCVTGPDAYTITLAS